MSGLRIAFFGSSLVSAYWNGAATYYRGIIRALAERGHQVTFYEPDVYDRQKHRDMDDPPWAKVVVYPAQEADLWRAVEDALDADVLIKTSGIGVFDDLLESTLPIAKRARTMGAFWDVDAPATLDRVTANDSDPFRAQISRYDLILTYGGGDRVVSQYKQLGARDCVPIYNALDPHTHFPVSPEARFAADLGFLGNRLPDRESRVDEFFLRAAEAAPEQRFLLGGNGWSDKAMPHNVRYIGHVFTRDHNAFNCSVRAVLNVNRASMASYGFSPPTRVFEAAGARACLICDAWEGIEMFLEPGREVLTARSGAEVADLMKHWTPARLREVGQAAYRRVLGQHTYQHRVNQLEEVIGLHAKIKRASASHVEGSASSASMFTR